MTRPSSWRTKRRSKINMWNRGWLNFRGQKKGQRICMWWLHAGFHIPSQNLILYSFAEANKVVNFKIWTCHAVHFYIGLTMSVERKTGERMIRHFVYLRGGHFIYLRGGSKFANISASAGHAPRRGHLLLFECSLLPSEGSLSCCMKCRLQILQPFFATVVDYAFIVQGPSPTSQGLSL